MRLIKYALNEKDQENKLKYLDNKEFHLVSFLLVFIILNLNNPFSYYKANL